VQALTAVHPADCIDTPITPWCNHPMASNQIRWKVSEAPHATKRQLGSFASTVAQVLPRRACSGIESSKPGCTDAAGEYIWANAWHESQQLGFKYSAGAPDWGMWINAPNRRGVHQVSFTCKSLLHGCGQPHECRIFILQQLSAFSTRVSVPAMWSRLISACQTGRGPPGESRMLHDHRAKNSVCRCQVDSWSLSTVRCKQTGRSGGLLLLLLLPAPPTTLLLCLCPDPSLYFSTDAHPHRPLGVQTDSP
jgi:hypothetical protein